ncbi:MAG TPA: hypothetical protein VGO43_11825 [Pyrinomonadaceae bacterium]|jgi:hypothetical protein|nr:hypothetical protein [Pyrinomonadaceae bacterium]
MGDCKCISEERVRRIIREELAAHHSEIESSTFQKSFELRIDRLLTKLDQEAKTRAAAAGGN